jgi:hypothetical protein
MALARADHGFVRGNILFIEIVKQLWMLRKHRWRQCLGCAQFRPVGRRIVRRLLQEFVKRDIEPEWLIGQSRELLQFRHTTLAPS